jgi:hypothetical protein
VVGDGDGDVSGDGDVAGDGDGDGDIACTDIYAYGLNVVVVGGAYPPPPGAERLLPPEEGEGGSTGKPLIPVPVSLCDSTVTAQDGAYFENLQCNPGSPTEADCTCWGAGERPGTYVVTAQWGTLTENQEITVTADECHVIGESLIFFDD